MLVLFTIPKAFHGHIATIQYNALKSWSLLGEKTRVVLFGNEQGSSEIAKELGIHHSPNIALNEFGTPIVSDVFSKANAMAEDSEILAYVNADIILTQDVLQSVRRMKAKNKPFLMIGQRWDIEQQRRVEFSAGWQDRLLQRVTEHGVLHAETGIDYFLFTRDLFGRIPDFAVGRTAWDNWLIFQARARRAMVVDASPAVTAIHQNHDYAHVSQGQYGAWKGPEAQRNLALAGGYAHCFTILDSTWILNKETLLPALKQKYLRRRLTAWIILHDRMFRASKLFQSGVKRIFTSLFPL